MRDLILLSADQKIEAVMRGLLTRPAALKIRPITAEYYTHRGRDPGCRTQAHDFLRPFSAAFRFALVVLDFDGSGGLDRTSVESEIESRLSTHGWSGRNAAIAIDPELEMWAWSDSPHVERILGWSGRNPRLRDWLAGRGLWPPSQGKPSDPKKSVEDALREARKPISATVYRELAEATSTARCNDATFQKFKDTIQVWFPR